LVSRVPIRFILDASEAAGVCRVADRVPSDLREWTQRPLELDAACGIVVYVVRGNDPFRSNALLHPALESLQEVVIGIDHRAVDAIAWRRALTKCANHF
jgi:hypothetical protein